MWSPERQLAGLRARVVLLHREPAGVVGAGHAARLPADAVRNPGERHQVALVARVDEDGGAQTRRVT